MKKLCLAILLLFCCLSASSAFALSPPADECIADSECPVGSECVRSPTTCVEWPEPGHEVCFSHMLCSEPQARTCTNNSDCLQGELCGPDPTDPVCDCAFIDDNGDGINDVDCNCPAPEMICQRPTMPNTCSTDAECGDGEVCLLTEPACGCPFIDDNGDGINDVECECPPVVGICQPTSTGCQSDAECGRGHICAPDPNAPTCDCGFIDNNGDGINDIDCACPPPELICQPGQTNPICDTDADCGPEEYCSLPDDACTCPFQDDDGDGINDVDCDCAAEAGRCERWPNAQCDRNSDCGPNEFCASSPIECPPCIDEEGSTCDCPPPARWCETRETTCVSDRDCADGQSCELPLNGVECTCPASGDCDCPEPRGICVESTIEECVSDAECGPSEQCVIGDEEICPPCAFIDENGDGENDIACDCLPAPGRCEPLPQTACTADADCGSGKICEIRESQCGCVDGDDNGTSLPYPDDCACEPAGGVCVSQGPIEPRNPGEPKFRWPQDRQGPQETKDDGDLFFCAAANTNTNVPAEGGVLLLMMVGVVGIIRRRRA